MKVAACAILVLVFASVVASGRTLAQVESAVAAASDIGQGSIAKSLANIKERPDVMLLPKVVLVELGEISDNHELYLTTGPDGVTVVNVQALKDAGFSDAAITYMDSYYKSAGEAAAVAVAGGQITTRSVPSKLSKQVIKLLVANKSIYTVTVKKTFGQKIADLVKIDLLLKALTKYLEVSDTVNQWLTNAINFLLPAWLEWATPGIVFIIELLLPL